MPGQSDGSFKQTTMHMLNESWAESRRTLCETVLKAHFTIPEDSTCCRCEEKFAVVRCHECPSTKHLCSNCDEMVHRSWPFHDRDVMVNGHYLPIPPTTSKGSDGEWVFVERGLPLSNILCPVCCSKCEPLEILFDSHCIVVTLRGIIFLI
ncbi:uncharacterized protein LOC114964356 [Acropora millepora]|uniref:uncharacterized protein LOC114964356 n=1 Tax=Acropora millepora TaxID=45264 RepID=UPI001CF4A485|nr:uncharacterized protein LOC114964356 [Acropora millepora]